MKFIALLFLGLGLTKASQIKCQPGQVPDEKGICIQPSFIEGCYQYSSTSACKVCAYKYKLNERALCQYQKFTAQPCCLKKNSSGICTQCNKGLMLQSNGQCRQINIVGCIESNQKGDCINCASDFYLKAGICQPGIKDCKTYSDESKAPEEAQICIECKKNFSLVNNSCLKNKILGCQYQIKHKCEKCLEPFTVKGDHCQIKNCQSYNDFGCTACDCGFYLNPQNTCQQIQPGCIRYQRGLCNACQSHFKLRGNTCTMQGCQSVTYLQCGKCKKGYQLVDGGCKLQNCQSWDNGVCHFCDDGYVIADGSCIQENSIVKSN